MAEHPDLRRALAHLQTAHRVAGLGSWEGVLNSTHDLYWSPEVFEIAGWPAEHQPGYDDFLALVHPDDRAAFLDTREAALAGSEPYSMDLRLVRPDGAVRHVNLAAAVVRDDDGTPVRLIGTVQDRTDQVAALEALRSTETDRRDLLRRLLVASDIERDRLARQVADGPMDRLEAIRDQAAAQASASDAPAWREACESVARAVASLQATVGAVVADEPTADLHTVLAGLADDVVPGVQVRIDAPTELHLPGFVRTTIVRVAQEALHNIRKHAEASRVTIAIRTTADDVILEIVDDGTGFDIETLAPVPGHLGLIAMRERVDLAGGQLHIASEPGATTIRVRLPVQASPPLVSGRP